MDSQEESLDRSVLIVDAFEKDDDITDFIDAANKKVFNSKCETTSKTGVYFITSGREITPPCAQISVIKGDNRLRSFYKAKRSLDNEDKVYVTILCRENLKQYWTSVCSCMFTPVHKWTITTIPCNDGSIADNRSVVQSVVRDIKTMLSQLPSLKELIVLSTSLIPKELFIHGYSTRLGGITTIQHLDSLNLLYTDRKRDSELTVQENIRRLGHAVGFNSDRFIVTRTGHGGAVWKTDTPRPDKYDAIITNEVGITLAAAGADCTPVLFVDPVKKVCGVSHCGYMGVLKSVVTNTIDALVSDYGCNVEDILVTLGPTICHKCFTFGVGETVVGQFQAIGESTIELVEVGSEQKAGCHLVKALLIQLKNANVREEHVDASNAVCTSCDPKRFFSFQRDGFPFGNQIGFVCIKP